MNFQTKDEIQESIERLELDIKTMYLQADIALRIGDTDQQEQILDDIEEMKVNLKRMKTALENFDTFTGEMMICVMSGAKRRSNPNVESGWDCVVVDDHKFYVSKKWREKSYRKRGIDKTWEMVLKKCQKEAWKANH
ncbi:MAG: hypothetical protein AAF846_22300 [Chloroflexota bacterium]